MKLSLCTSLFNSRKYLEIFIKSIETQSYQNWELLLCDDFSQDLTKDFLKEKKKTNKKIFLQENKINLGLTRSLINLINKIDENGYVVRLDDDEIHISEYLISLSYLFKKGHDLIVYTEFPNLAKIISKLHSKNKLLASLFLALIGNIGTHGGTAYTKRLYTKTGGYSKSFFLSQDYHLLIRLLKYSEKPIFVNSLNYKPFEIPRLNQKLSINESLMQKIFSLISISGLFNREAHTKSYTFILFTIVLVISIPIKLIRSILYKII
jgi:glycosyltransferase involved in cell wall biosynthesis